MKGWSYSEVMGMPEDERWYWYEKCLDEHRRRREQEEEANSRASFTPVSL